MSKVIPTKENYAFNIRDDRSIHLAIPTNILCVDNRLEAKFLSVIRKQTKFFADILSLQDFTATLYLGKITFKKNKQNILSPIYTPSKIVESSFENLNLFWLNEINQNAKTPFKSLIKCEFKKMLGEVCEIDSTAMDYQKIHYFRTDKNIILNKNQIMSYFIELHSLNTAFIKNYIDSINNKNGIVAYNLHKEIFSNLLESKILTKDLFEWYSNGNFSPSNEAMILALDYLKANNQANFKIVLFDELFYAYLVWSLKEYVMPYYQGRFQDENHLLFNAGAYKIYANQLYMPNPYKNEFENSKYDIKNFYTNISPTEYEVGYIEGYEWFFKHYGSSFFHHHKNEAAKLPKSIGYSFSSPNNIAKPQITLYDKKQEPIFAPSPLGKYYFELSDSLGSFIEYFPKLYPQKPPKYWSKEMMSRLDLKLG